MHEPSLVLHNRTVLSSDAEATYRPHGEKHALVTLSVCPSSVKMMSPVVAFQICTVWSDNADNTKLPSGENEASDTMPPYASGSESRFPVSPSHISCMPLSDTVTMRMPQTPTEPALSGHIAPRRTLLNVGDATSQTRHGPALYADESQRPSREKQMMGTVGGSFPRLNTWSCWNVVASQTRKRLSREQDAIIEPSADQAQPRARVACPLSVVTPRLGAPRLTSHTIISPPLPLDAKYRASGENARE